jgi:hypothetical protein
MAVSVVFTIIGISWANVKCPEDIFNKKCACVIKSLISKLVLKI